MKKVNTTTAREIGKLEGQRLTIGLDLGDRSSYYCVLDEAGRVFKGKSFPRPRKG